MLSPRRPALSAMILAALLMVAPVFAGTSRKVIRIVDVRLAAMFQDATAASPTLRRTVQALERSDLIVHVVPLIGQEQERWVAGYLQFVGTMGQRRYLRIAVRPTEPREVVVEILGHELHHALELAGAPGVVDDASFAAFLEAAGHPMGGTGGSALFDTPDARRAGRQVRREYVDNANSATAGSQ